MRASSLWLMILWPPSTHIIISYPRLSTSFFTAWVHEAPPPLQPRLNRHRALLAPQLLSQLHALHGPRGHLQPPDGHFMGNFRLCHIVTHYTKHHTMYYVSYHICIISFDIVSFDIDSIPIYMYYVYINTISACSMYAILYYTYHTSSTAQGGGGSFKNRKRIGEIDCCE